MKVSCSIDISSTPETVFHWLGRPEYAMVWMTTVSKTEMLHETPDMVGSTFREYVEEDGQGIEMQGVVTGYVPNKSISFHLDSRVNTVDVDYLIEGAHEGVRLSENENVVWKFPMNIISIFTGTILRQNLVEQLREEFNKLKELSEGELLVIPSAGKGKNPEILS